MSSGPCVSNAGPLIHLAKINKLYLLKELFGRVIIPRAVEEEVVDRGRETGAADAFAIEEEIKKGWIEVREYKSSEAVANRAGIEVGEAAAILLAREINAPVLLDDAAARAFASAFGVEVAGSIAVILKSARYNKMSKTEALDALDELANVMWISPIVYRKARKSIEEM